MKGKKNSISFVNKDYLNDPESYRIEHDLRELKDQYEDFSICERCGSPILLDSCIKCKY